MKEVEFLIGRRLIDKTDLKKYKMDIKKLYSDLSKHVHSSYEKLNPVFEYSKFEHNIQFSFNERMLNECIDLMNRTLDVIFLLIFSYDAQLISKIGSETFIKSIKNMYPLTAKLIEDNTASSE